MARSDKRLHERWIESQDAEAFRQIALRHSAMVHSTCQRILRDPSQAEDVSQECFQRLASHCIAVRSLAAWLYRVATNLSLKRLRAEKRRKERETSYVAARSQTAAEAGWTEIREHVDRAMAELPEEFRQALVLHFIENQTHKAIASEIGISRSTVTYRIQKGVQLVREKLRRGGFLVSGVTLASLFSEKLAAETAPASLLANLGKMAIAGTGKTPAPVATVFSIIGIAVMAKKVALSVVLALGTLFLVWYSVSQPNAPQSDVRSTSSHVSRRAASKDPTTQPLAEKVIIKKSPNQLTTLSLELAVSWQESSEPVADATVRWSEGDRTPSESHSLTTNAEGKAVLSYPTEWKAAWINVRHPVGSEQQVRVELPRENVVEIKLRTAHGIAGVVRDLESGAPLPGAVVVSGEQRSETDDSGRYMLAQLDDGVHSLFANAMGYAAERAIVEITQAGTSSHDFSLGLGIDAHVLVLDETGIPLEGVTVTPSRSGATFHSENTRTTDADGYVIFEDMCRRRRGKFKASKPGYQTATERPPEFEKEDDVYEVTFVLPIHDPTERLIVGRVTDQRENPLAGLTVQWVPQTGGIKAGDKAITDASGSYGLSFRHEFKACLLVVYGDGWPPVLRRGVLAGTPESPTTVDIVLPPGQWLEGRVVDEEGSPVRGSTISAQPDLEWTTDTYWHVLPGVHRRSKTDVEGWFRLEGLWGPTVGLRIHGPRGGDWSPVETDNVIVNQTTQIVLKRRGVIRGRVLDSETGQPISVFKVKAEQGPGYSVGETRSFTSADGRFSLESLDRSRAFQVTVQADGYVATFIEDVPALPESQAEEEIIQLSKGRHIEGTVIDSSTKSPVAHATVVLAVPGEVSFSWVCSPKHVSRAPSSQTTVTDQDGTFFFREADPGSILVLAEGYRRLLISPEERSEYLTSSARLVIALEDGESLTGVYYDENNKPRKDAWVRLYRLDQESGSSDEPVRHYFGAVKTDEKGVFSWDTLWPGTYLLETTRNFPGGVHTEQSSSYRRVELESDEDKFVELGNDLGPIVFRGRLLDENGAGVGAWLYLRPAFQWHYVEFSASSSTEHASRFWFPGLEPGKYTLEAVIFTNSGKQRIALPSIQLDRNTETDLEVAFDER